MSTTLASLLARGFMRSAVVFSLIGTAFAADPVQPNPQDVSLAPGQRNVASGVPRIWLAESQSLPLVHVGPGASRLAAGAQPLSMVSTDLEGSGIPGLLLGYNTPNGGVVVWHRGNIDAFAPQSDASFQAIAHSQFPSPFMPEAQAFNVPARPDFIAVGDFTGHGQVDLAVAARGGSAVYVLSGDGKGHFSPAATINSPGGVTALAADRFGLRSALLVGASGPKRSYLAVYALGAHGLVSLAALPLNAPASNILFADFGDPGRDAAFLSGGQVFILRSSNLQLVNVGLPVAASAFALGSFVYDRNGGPQFAVLASDGSTQIAARNEFDPRVYTVDEFLAIRRAKVNHQVSPLVPAPSFPGGWRIVEGFPSVGAVNPGQDPVFFRTRISDHGADDILWMSAAGRMALISHADVQPGAATVSRGLVSVKAYNGSPVRALPVRTNVDGRLGIVAIHQNELAPSMSHPIPDPTFFPNEFADPAVPLAGGVPDIANFCNNTSNTDTTSPCSLREAIIKANATAGTDTIMLAAGTYTLTQPRAATPNYDAVTGTLNINDSVNIVGAGQSSTIITWGTPASGTVDMVMAVNEDVLTTTTASASISNLTIQNGVNNGTQGVDGDGGCMEFDTGTNGTATLALTNVTLQNCQTLQGDGGGLVLFNFVVPSGGGTVTISNSIIQGNSVVASGQAGSGGGIAINLDAHMTMTASEVLNNSAVQNCTPTCGLGAGGGIVAFTPQNVSAATGESFIHSSTISGNKAAGFGGGINTSASISIDQGTVISGNIAGTDGSNNTAHANQEGGGLYLNPAATCPLASTCTATLSKVTITGNKATGNGGGISYGNGSVGTVGALTMSFSRLAGNTTSGGSGSNLSNQQGTATVTDNWWGTNAASGTIDAISGTTTFDPFIQLRNSANPAQIQPGQSSTLTGDMSQDNHGSGAALAGNLDVLQNLLITFNNAVLGTIAEAQPELINSFAQATATYTAGATGGTGSVDATVDQQTVTAQITVIAPPTAAKSFNPAGIPPNGTSVLTITITNPAANALPITGLAFTDTFPANVVLGTPDGLTNTCGGAASDSPSSVSLANGTVAANSSCTVSVTVTSAATGSYVNTLGPVSSNAGNSNSASATLNVAFPPTISKLFLPTTITAGSTSLLSFTINNPNSNSTPPNNDMILTGIQFTDTLPAGVVVATPNQLSNNCDGTVTAVPGSGSITLVGGDLGAAVQLRPRGIKLTNSRAANGIKLLSQPSANGSCFISVEVTAPAAGTFNNTTGAISANESGAGAASNTATLTVQAAPTVNPPTVSKTFGVPSFALNGTTSLTFTIANPNAQPLVNILLNDPLPAGLVVANPNGLTDGPGTGCIANSAVVFANPGSHNVNMVGLVLPANTSCSYSVNVTGVTSGLWVNTTNPITATFNDGSDNFVGITGGSATASVVVELPPVISKAFSPALIAPNGVSTLIFTITNPSVNVTAESGVAFTDTLPGSLVVATPSGATGNCNGGTFTAVAGTNSISLTGGTIPVNSSCVLSVNVTGAVTSTVTNTTGPVSSTNGGTGNTASATLSIKPANLSITKTHQGDFHRRESGTYTITVSNDPNAGPTLGTVTVVDTLPVIGNPHNLVPTVISGAGWTCTLATLTCTRSDVVAPGASYPPISLTVDVPQNITANVVNSATVSGGGDPNTHEADDPTHIGPPLNVSPMDLDLSAANMTVPAGGSGSFMFDVESSKGLGMVTLSCSGLPMGGACSFSPAETNKLSTIVTMTITVPPHSASASPWPLGPGANTYALLFPALGLLGIVFVGRKKPGKQSWKLRLLGLAGAAMLLALISCGGAPQSMTPPQQPLTSYQVTVTASAGTVTSSTTITLNVR